MSNALHIPFNFPAVLIINIHVDLHVQSDDVSTYMLSM